MKFSKAQIAALVLGYLRREKLSDAVDAFLNSCSYLHESDEKIKMGKYFVTRVGGLTLVDYLEEYSEIYAIVQARIEETDCYERYDRPTLVQQLLFLLDQEQPNLATSTPVMSAPCELEATPAHELPGNSSIDSDGSLPKTPKKRNPKNKCKEKEDVVELEVLTQSLLEKHELHEKIAETINTVMNTPEVAKPVTDEHISAGASKELDAVIKTVIQRTEEDPLYNKLIDEIIGQNFCPTNCENQKKSVPCSTPTTSLTVDDPPAPTPPSDPMDDHNNDAIRSIIEAAQNTDPPPAPPQPESAAPSKTESQPNGEVYVFDGNLDTYLKTSGVTNTINSNPVFFNPGGLIVVPPPDPTKQFYIVNNQPLIKMNVPTVVTEKELMSMPTVIVSDENPSCAKRTKSKTKGEDGAAKSKVTEGLLVPSPRDNVVVTRQASHVRNLDFSTPSSRNEGAKPKKKQSWDEDLRMLVGGCKDKSPLKKKRPTTAKKKPKKPDDKPPLDEKVDDPENLSLLTPVKDAVPKTPGAPDAAADTSNLHCTPFTAVLEEQLQGVDINSLPTPNIPITPGFTLTPGEVLGPNQRLTDYSTSSSYYQPSDSEQKTMTDLIEESKQLDTLSPTKPNISILSNVVIEKSKNNGIGKKNLSLIKRTLSSSSSESESDLETTAESTNKTVICKKNHTTAIKDIISNVEVKSTLDEETRKKNLLSQLEEKRQRTIQKIKNPEEPKKAARGRKKTEKTPKTPKATKRKAKKKVVSTEENTDEEAQKLVTNLAERGIHLVHNKTPKKTEVKESETQENESEETFDTRTYEDEEIVEHNSKWKKRSFKSYDFTLSTKSMSANVFIEELNTEMTRTMKWGDIECVFDSTRVPSPVKDTSAEMDELMDYCIVGSVREESPDMSEAKGGKKRKSKFDDDDRNKDKRNKTFENLLKNIDVDDFLNKVHGE
ncbi:proteoglycan 4-like [Zophobas morio]|uniref:proteoglycan 4-like n=1 Tax=Zophobas morio TaxID=2755281 RepID=UPI0030835CE3